MIKIVGINPITLDVYLSDGSKLHVHDFFDTPKVGYGVEMMHDIGYRCIPVGDDTECVSWGVNMIMEKTRKKMNELHNILYETNDVYRSMFKDDGTNDLVIKEIQEFERLAKIGEATEKAFGFSECDDYLAQVNKTHNGQFVITGEVFANIDGLLEWAVEND